MNLPYKKVYAQLEPTKVAELLLLHAQRSLDETKTRRLVDASELHVTLMHFGELEKVYAELEEVTSLSNSLFEENVREVVMQFEAILSGKTFELHPKEYAFLGHNQKTLALIFHATPALQDIHARLYSAVYQFVSRCGIEDVTGFLKVSSPLRFADTLLPHVTLAKSYRGVTPKLDLTPLQFTLMPVTYLE